MYILAKATRPLVQCHSYACRISQASPFSNKYCALRCPVHNGQYLHAIRHSGMHVEGKVCDPGLCSTCLPREI